MRAAACPRLGERPLYRLVHRDDIVAVDLLALDAGGYGLLRQGFGGSLLHDGQRDRPAVVVDHEYDRQLPHPGDIERLGDIALRGRAVAEDADGDALLAPQLEGQRDTDRMRRVRPDRHADREILASLGEIAAPLVAAPEKEELDRADTAPQLRAVLAEARQQQIFRPHRTGDADRHGLLAERRGEGTEPSGALQRHRFGIEAPRQYHRAVERDELRPVAGEIRQWAHRVALGVEKTAVADLEPRDGGRDRRSPRLGNRGELFGCFGRGHHTPSGISELSQTALFDMW